MAGFGLRRIYEGLGSMAKESVANTASEISNAASNSVTSWDQYKKANPVKAGVVSVLPGTGQVTAALDYAQAQREGDTPKAFQAALGAVPGVKLVKTGSRLAPPVLRVGMNAVERALNPLTKRSHLIGMVNDGGDVGESAAQTYNNTQAKPAIATKPQPIPVKASLSDGTA